MPWQNTPKPPVEVFIEEALAENSLDLANFTAGGAETLSAPREAGHLG